MHVRQLTWVCVQNDPLVVDLQLQTTLVKQLRSMGLCHLKTAGVAYIGSSLGLCTWQRLLVIYQHHST